MAKPRTQSKTDSEPKSEALKNFESNLHGIVFFIKETGTKHLQRRINSFKSLVGKKVAGVIPDSTLSDSLGKIGSAIQKEIRMMHFRSEWIGVMLITFLMAYLEDCLMILAERDKSLLKDAPAIDSRRVLDAASIDEISVEIRKAWAERFMQGVGPEGWSKRLSTLGVRGYETADILAMQHLFDTRN